MQVGRTIARTILPIAVAAFIATGCGGEDGVLGVGGIPDDAICSVNGSAVSQKDFDQLVEGAKLQYKDNEREFPKKDSDEFDQLRGQVTTFLIQRELIREQADKNGVSVSDKEVDKGVKDLKKQLFQDDEKKFKAELKRTGYTEDRVRDDVKDQKLSEKLYKKITTDIKVSDKDAKEYFDDNSEQFVQKESRDVAHILVKTKAQADKIYELVKGGDEKVFAAQAKANTQDPSSKETGGVLTGGVQRGQTVPEFDKTAFALKTGQVSKPVKTSFGYHIITARGDVKAEKTQKFGEVEGDIKKQLKSQNESQRYEEWQKDVNKDAEDDVDCRTGYVWSQTATETETAKADTGTEEKSEEKSGDSKGADASTEEEATGNEDAKDEDAKNSGDAEK